MRKGLAFILMLGCSAPEHGGIPARIGKRVRPLVLNDLHGGVHALAGNVAVLLFTGVDCPVANAYLGRVANLANEYPQAAVLAVNSNWNDSVAKILEHARWAAFSVPIVKDGDHALADLFGIEITPTAVVLDSRGILRYRGRIDDNKMENLVSSRDLRRALEETLGRRPVSVPETEPFG